MKDKKICIVCGKEFIPKRYDSRICSKECLKNYKSKSHLIENKNAICEICGKQFIKKRACQRTCSRECGDKLRLYNYTIKPKKEKPAKKEKILYNKQCECCNKEFTTYYKYQKFCCVGCRIEKHKKPKKTVKLYNNTCVWCGKEFTSKQKAKYCSKQCHIKCISVNRLHHRPYKMNNSKVNRVYRNKIGDRDNWICNICGKSIDKDLKYPDPMSASLDHIIPLSKGGKHCEENVHISHLHCNILKAIKHSPGDI